MAHGFKVIVMMAALLLCAASPGAAATFTAKRGLNLDIWTTWPGQSQWADRDILLPFPEWRKFLGAADLEKLKRDGFDFLRMPVDPAPFLVAESEVHRPDLYASVLESARLITAAGLKVVVDLHAIPAGGGRTIGTGQLMDDPALFDRYVEHVRTMARTLAQEEPAKVALELMNEPTTGCEGEEASQWTERLRRLFAAARASATQLTLVLSGACWSSAEGLSAVDPADFPDDNLMWTFHSYDPFLMTHQGATWAGDFIRYVTGLPYPPHAAPKAELDAAVDRVKARIDAEAPWLRRSGMKTYLDELLAEIDSAEKLDAVIAKPFAIVDAWARRHGVSPDRILLGEFGMIRQEYGGDAIVPAAVRAAYLRDMIEHAETYGFAWSIWGYGGAFGVVEAFEGKPAEPDVLDMVRSLPR